MVGITTSDIHPTRNKDVGDPWRHEL